MMSTPGNAPSSINRRNFLQKSALSLPAAYALTHAGGWHTARAADEMTPGGLVIRELEPENLEMPFSSLDGFITPTKKFYVRSHFPTPDLEPKTWRLKVEGAVEKPVELTYDALRKLPVKTIPVTLECAGNGRIFLDPPVKGVQWAFGGVGNARWTGVSLAAVLEQCGVKPDAVDVIFEGADRGVAGNEPPGEIHYTRSLPLKKAQHEDVLLCYQMNGEDLTPSHGFPLRLIVPGWYGMASIKWLQRIVVSPFPYVGHYQSFGYTYFTRPYGLPHLEPIDEILVKSSIARPAMKSTVPRGKPYKVFGAAWAGPNEIVQVEVSTDGGDRWTEARLLDKPVKYAWQLWEHQWKVPDRADQVTLMCRATDSAGNKQPMERDPDRRTYMINHVIGVDVTVA